jgi:hypothetical protein
MLSENSKEIKSGPVKRKRPDRAQACVQKKFMKESVVKVSLPGHLKETMIYSVLEKWILLASKTMYRGSLVFNRLLLHFLEKKEELPILDKDKNLNLFIHCFKVGVRNTKINPDVKEVWSTNFNGFPVDPSTIGDTQTYVCIAKAYAVAFLNSLQFCFEKRQKLYIVEWLKKKNLDKNLWHSIRCAVNNWKCKSPPPTEAEEFINSQRSLLNPPSEGISIKWIKNNPCSVVKYFFNILQFLDEIPEAKKFSLAPLHRITRHFLTIDTEILYYLMKEAKLLDDSISKQAFRKEREFYYQKIFKYQSLSRGEFTYTVQTDGVSICFHFRSQKVVNCYEREQKIDQRNIAIDPGRTNLVFAVERLSDGNNRTFKLSRKEYYTSSGMNERKRRCAKWQHDIAEEETTYSLISPKTCNSQQWDNFLKNVVLVYSKLWEGKTGKKWAREKFRVYGLKRKLIDRFFQRMNGKSKPQILYGAAKFNPNSRNELSAPTTFMSSSCARFFPIRFVDEFYTSKICAKCNQVLSPVVTRDKKGQVREIRGLRRCKSNVCSQAPFMNRDLNAALNILRCGIEAERPTCLARETRHPKGDRWMMGKPESRKHESASIPERAVVA